LKRLSKSLSPGLGRGWEDADAAEQNGLTFVRPFAFVS